MSFEEDLRRSLRRESPPPDFAERVVARAAAMEAEKPKRIMRPVWRRPIAWAIAAGLIVAALVPVGVNEYRRQREARAAVAGRQLALALNITRIQLQKTKEKLQKASKQHPL